MQVPPELKEDLILIADKIEPYLLQVKEQADKIPEKAHELAAKIEPAAQKLGDKIEETADKVGKSDLRSCCGNAVLLTVLVLWPTSQGCTYGVFSDSKGQLA